MSKDSKKNFSDLLEIFIPFFVILIIFIFIILGKSYNKYEILFYSLDYETDRTVSVSIDGLLNEDTFEVENISRKDLMNKKNVKLCTYEGYKFYAYVDDTITYDYLLDNGLSEFIMMSTPINMSENTEEQIIKYEYIESNIKVYDSQIFTCIEEIKDNKIAFFVQFSKGFCDYITGGEGLVLLLSACFGCFITDLLKFLLKVLKN